MPILDAYLLTRLAAIQGLCSNLFALAVAYWIARGAIAAFRHFDDGLFDELAIVAIWLRKATLAATILMAVSGIGSILLPDKTDVMLMVGNQAATNVATAIESN